MTEQQNLIKAARMALEPLRIYMTDEQLGIVVEAVMNEQGKIINSTELLNYKINDRGKLYDIRQSSLNPSFERDSKTGCIVKTDRIELTLQGVLIQ